jgi:hypothetical protein
MITPVITQVYVIILCVYHCDMFDAEHLHSISRHVTLQIRYTNYIFIIVHVSTLSNQ